MEALLQIHKENSLLETLTDLVDDFKFIEVILDENTAKQFYKQLGWFESGDYFPNVVTGVLSGFVRNHQEIIKDYMMLKTPLYEVCKKLITFINEQRISFDRDKLYSCLVHYADPVDSEIKKILGQRRYQKHLNILGFGLRDGAYEKVIANMLSERGLADTIKIYGFDPYSKEANSDIEMLSPSEISTNTDLKFDIILARWVLHHIHYDERWDDFTNCFNQCAVDSTLIIVEEGSFSSSFIKTKEVLLCKLLLGLADVFINSALHQRWLIEVAPGIDPPFFIEYLSPEDIIDIESKVKVNKHRVVCSVGPPFFKQTLITYRVSPIEMNNTH